MNAFALIPLLVAATALAQTEEGGPVSVDGGQVKVLVPSIMEKVSQAIAPELVPDGGSLTDGGLEPVIAPQSLSVYKVDLPAEAALTAGSFGLYFMVDILIKPSLQGDISCRGGTGTGRCDPSTLDSFDRYSVGRSQLPSAKGWLTFSDVALATAIVLPVLYLGLESLALPTNHPLGDFLNDLLVVTESMALTASVDTVLKFAFRRPRPDRYLAVDAPTTFDSELSLPSGHTALVTAATTALSTTIFMRHPQSKVRFVVLGLGLALSAMTGLARVQAGQHFPTDVITGFFVGAVSGFVVPYLHLKPTVVMPSVAFNPATGATMFTVSGGL